MVTCSQEEQIKELQTKIVNIDNQKQFSADQAAVQAAQMEMLTTLRTIRAAIVSSGNNLGASSKELEDLKAENEQLKKTNTKQRYRINHLVKGMEEMQKKL